MGKHGKEIKKGIEVNEFGVNRKIKGKIIAKSKMKKYGFQEDSEKWYQELEISSKYHIYFYIEIYKDNPADKVNIVVSDKDFGFIYDYQKLMNSPRNMVASMVNRKVEQIMEELQALKILSGHIKGEFI